MSYLSPPVAAFGEARLPLAVVFDLEGDGCAAALLRVCGLPVLLRNVLLCQRHRVARVIVACRSEDRPRVEAALAIRKLTLPLTWATDGPGAAMEALAPHGPDLDVLHWPGSLSFGRFFPEALGADRGRPFVLRGPGSEHALTRAPAHAWASAAGRSWTERAGALGLPAPLPLASVPLPLHDVRDRASARAAEADLLRSLRKNADGAVAKYDRYVSLAISRLLMKLPVTPNQVTCAAALLGALCGVLVAGGGYTRMLLGALAFQFNSIFDGIDGEIARAKLLESRLGQWLDTLADDFSNFAFVVGVGLGCYHTHQWSGYWVLGLIAGLGQLCSSAVQYHYIITVVGSGDLNDFKPPWETHAPSQRPRRGQESRGLVSKIEWIFRRDAFVAMSTAFALVGQLRILTWGFAIGANLVWTSVVGYRLLRGLDASGQRRRTA